MIFMSIALKLPILFYKIGVKGYGKVMRSHRNGSGY